MAAGEEGGRGTRARGAAARRRENYLSARRRGGGGEGPARDIKEAVVKYFAPASAGCGRRLSAGHQQVPYAGARARSALGRNKNPTFSRVCLARRIIDFFSPRAATTRHLRIYKCTYRAHIHIAMCMKICIRARLFRVHRRMHF